MNATKKEEKKEFKLKLIEKSKYEITDDFFKAEVGGRIQFMIKDKQYILKIAAHHHHH